MLSIVIKGILIGILVSAPMGPIGILCIQRTLNKGRWHGFCTGIGATFSDLFYATITGFGMGFVVDFIEKNQILLQISGSILLMLFGFYTYKTNPSKSLKKPEDQQENTYTQDTLTSFFLTLSNPFIIFLFLGLFARFNFIIPEETIFALALGLIAIAIGALSWWFLVTYLVGKLRSNFNVRGLWIMNRTLGVIIIVLSVVGLIFSFYEAPPL